MNSASYIISAAANYHSATMMRLHLVGVKHHKTQNHLWMASCIKLYEYDFL